MIGFWAAVGHATVQGRIAPIMMVPVALIIGAHAWALIKVK